MKNPFKKEGISFKSTSPLTPYQRAQREWDLRIGTARIQAKNWRLVAIFSLLIALSLICALVLVLVSKKDHLYIAEVSQEGKVVNVAPLLVKYQPTEAQKNFFLAHFIELVRSVPMDPVLAKKNWTMAYNFLNGRSAAKLNEYFRQNSPVNILGKKTVATQILDLNPISPTTTHVDWLETTTNSEGQEESSKNYSGVFSIAIKQPTKQKEILNNPLGFYIVDFNISPKASFKKQ